MCQMNYHPLHQSSIFVPNYDFHLQITYIMSTKEESNIIIEKSRLFMEKNGSSSSEIRVFSSLLNKMLTENAHINWNEWTPLRKELQKNLHDLPVPSSDELLTMMERLVVIRLNGGLGTTMGCNGPKSIIEVKEGLSFLEIALKQHETFCERFNVHVPILLMNSFNTHEETVKRVGGRARCFVQSRCPRLDAETLSPYEEGDESWYPPGHGNIFVALNESGIMNELLQKGKDIIFVSNIDNTGAKPAMQILKMIIDNGIEYAMECTEKTQMDLKGGTLIEINNGVMHLEIPQVPPEHLDDFCSTRVFSIFNTNNIWVNLRSVVHRPFDITAEIIFNRKKTSSGRNVIQLETSIGGAIKNFSSILCVHVPRSRFIPVKGTSDLLAVSSTLYSLDDSFCLRLNSLLPRISLSHHFNTVSSLHSRFALPPCLRNVNSLCIDGDISFDGSVVFEGDVSLHASSQFVVPHGSHYKNERKELS